MSNTLVYLPAKGISTIGISSMTGKLYYSDPVVFNEGVYFYKLSDEVIRLNDWTYGILDNINYKNRVCKALENMVMLNYPDIAKIYRRKIIATNDPVLIEDNVPALSESFLQELCKNYSIQIKKTI